VIDRRVLRNQTGKSGRLQVSSLQQTVRVGKPARPATATGGESQRLTAVYSIGMRTLVTGGAGCIGSDLAGALLARGDHVSVIDNLSSGKTEHLAPMRSHPNFSFLEGDLRDAALIGSVMDGIDMVYHLAANPDVKFSEGDATDKDLQQNVICTYNVLEAMRRAGVRRIAFASTSAVYGISPLQPIPESAFFPAPISLYGATKLGCESLIGAFQNLFGWQAWIFRFANIVGPKVRKTGRTVIGDFVVRLREDSRTLRILGDGKQAKSYLLSEECVDAMLFLVEHAREPLNVYNLACSDSLQVSRIADMVVEALGLSGVEYEFTGGEGGWPGDVPRFRLDPSKLNRLGWTARHNSEEAVRIAIGTTIAALPRQAACKP
jgi:UDP-glucose 4-epimerase